MTKKRIIFMGTPEFSVNVLQAIVNNEAYQVEAVVTQPDKPAGRNKKLKKSPVKECAEQLDIKIYQPEKLSGSKELEELIDLEADLIITAAYGQFLPTSLLESAKIAAINVHASLLPKYRGGAPVEYAIMNGDDKTGVTIMYMVKKMDAGDIISCEEIAITKDDNVESMFNKLSVLGSDLLLKTLPDLINNQIEPIAQNEEEVVFSPNITKDQQKLDFETETAQMLDYHVRALYPFHPSYVEINGERIKLALVRDSQKQTDLAPGTIVFKDKNTLEIAAANNTVVSIQKLQPAGKKLMDIKDFLNGKGAKLSIGEKIV